METILLSIIIPYHDETEGQIFPLLSSIHNQIAVDFTAVQIILVNDGSQNILDREFLLQFSNLQIKTVCMEENKGPGLTRQAGLDLAKSKYVMFCDADDLLYSSVVLCSFIREIQNKEIDIIFSPWLEEIYDDNVYSYTLRDNEITWLHGKIFRLDFLRDNNIRFHENLRIHEDSFFMSTASELTNNISRLVAPSYVWRWRKDSIVRRNHYTYAYESFPMFNHAVCLSIKELEKRGVTDNLHYKVTQLIIYNYMILNTPTWKQLSKNSYQDAVEYSLLKEISPFINYFNEIPCEMRTWIYEQEREKHLKNGSVNELFIDWLNRIGLLNL